MMKHIFVLSTFTDCFEKRLWGDIKSVFEKQFAWTLTHPLLLLDYFLRSVFPFTFLSCLTNPIMECISSIQKILFKSYLWKIMLAFRNSNSLLYINTKISKVCFPFIWYMNLTRSMILNSGKLKFWLLFS